MTLPMTSEDIDRDTRHLASFDASAPRLFAIAYRILGVRADAEDVVQEAFLKWHGTRNESIESPLAWLTTVTKRTAIDTLRRRRSETLADIREAETGLDNAINAAPSAHALVEQASDLSHGMRRVIERLSAEERAAFLLREAFEADYARIGEILDRSAAHCRQMVHRARIRVRDDNRRVAHHEHDAAQIAPLLDAIARQDMDALVALMVASHVTASAASAVNTSGMASAEHITRALISRLRLGLVSFATA